MLWIGTVDVANGVNPQSLASLGGKVLRVTGDGAPAPGNPTITVNGVTAEPRIYTYCHRNVQGMAFRPSGGTFITGTTWGTWNGAFAIAQLVGEKLVVLTFNRDGSLKTQTNLFADEKTRLLVPVTGPDGAMYIATDVGGHGGEIWRVTPG